MLYIVIMKPIELKKNNFIHPATGAGITFHMIRWEEALELDSVGLQQAGNVLFHSLQKTSAAHFHQFFEILIMLKGRMKHHVNGTTQELFPGHIVFIRPHDLHSFSCVNDEDVEAVNLVLESDLIKRLKHYLDSDIISKRLMMPPVPPCFKIKLAESEELALRLLKINALQVTAPEVAAVRVRALTAELFSDYFLNEDRFIQEKTVPAWFEELCRKMKKQASLINGLQEMQRMAACTPSHLCKSFRKYLDKSPTEFINELRLQRAAKMLIESDDKILAVAMDLGFQSLSRFYALFSKVYGVSPGKYRSLAKSNQIPSH